MSHPKLKLYVAPGSCTRVPTIALEEIGVPFETELVRLAQKQHKSPEFLAVNPKGKVPVLVIDDYALSENVAILTWLNRTYPEANLLPETKDDLASVQQIADLAFFSGTLHPFVTRIAKPDIFVTDAQKADMVREAAVSALNPYMALINQRLSDQPWWYGETWSICDGYFFWIWWRLHSAGYDGSQYTNLASFEKRILQRPAVIRALEREEQNLRILAEERKRNR